MALDLSSYKQIQTNLFVKVVIPGYQTIAFSDYHKVYTFGSVSYTGVGELLSVSNTTSSLRATPEELSITISGIPTGNISDFVDQTVRGSQCDVHRGFFDATTGELLPISGNPAGKFLGVLNNFAITNDQNDNGEGTVTITFTCTSVVDQLNNKISGRATNPVDQKALYPADISMDRVPALAKSNFNFGASE